MSQLLTTMDHDERKSHALEVFPEVVWLNIFKWLGPHELYSFSKACKTFAQLLEPQRTTILTAVVLPLLKFPEIMSTSILLNSRLVCRLWKRALEEHCESFKFFERAWLSAPRPVEDFLVTSFKKREDCERFVTFMESRPLELANPFLSRGAHFNDGLLSEDNLLRDYWDCVLELLQKFGTHLWYCEIRFMSRDSESVRKWYDHVLFRLMTLVPNLRALRIYTFESESCDSYESTLRPALFHKLNWLSIGLRSATTKAVLLSCDSHALECLELVAARNLEEWPVDVMQKFEKLKVLKCTGPIATPLIAVTRFLEVRWPLVEADLDVYPDPKSENTLSSLFDWANQFRDTMQKLTLTFKDRMYSSEEDLSISKRFFPLCGKMKDDDSGLLPLDLPKLKELRITTSESLGFSSLDFTVDLKQLERLSLSMWDLPPPGKRRLPWHSKEKIQFTGYTDKMLYSNIWQVLPKLKFLRLEGNRQKYTYHWKGSPRLSLMNKS